MPNTLSEALEEAYATAPAGQVILHTLEFRHPSFTVPLRVVNDQQDFIGTLEASAPIDPSTAVTFTAFAFELIPPSVESTGSMPEITITIDNVSRDILGYMDLAANSPNLIEVTYRPYLSTDTSEPQMNPPLTMTVRTVEADIFRITAIASFGDFINKAFPATLYDSTRFPALIAS